jgi:hypothetical protein
MRELFRANPPPRPEPEPEQEPAVEEPVQVAPVPVLADSTVRTAKAIALQVWAGRLGSRSRLFDGQNQSARTENERALDLAIESNWVATSGDQLVRGSVNPSPNKALPDERARGWTSLRSR